LVTEELKLEKASSRPVVALSGIDWLGWTAIISMTLALFAIFILAPTERVQGVVQRLFYFHVASAYLAYASFAMVLVASVLYLLKRSLRIDIWARSSAEIGVMFISLNLITGIFWMRQVWGAWWTWDPRLTTTLILWFLYAAYLMLRSYAGSDHRGAAFGSVIGVFGAAMIPIVHFSVTWWRTIHPAPTVLREGGPAMPATMIVTMLIAILASSFVYVYLLRTRLRIEDLRERLTETHEARH
jgi:heme exporter protein C